MLVLTQKWPLFIRRQLNWVLETRPKNINFELFQAACLWGQVRIWGERKKYRMGTSSQTTDDFRLLAFRSSLLTETLELVKCCWDMEIKRNYIRPRKRQERLTDLRTWDHALYSHLGVPFFHCNWTLSERQNPKCNSKFFMFLPRTNYAEGYFQYG